MVRSERSTAGTVEQAATPVISTLSPASRPRKSSPSSSAVDRESVLTRQLWTSLSPSKVASTVLVFPMSMQSSTRLSFHRLGEIHRDVQDRRGVGQAAHREVVDAQTTCRTQAGNARG